MEEKKVCQRIGGQAVLEGVMMRGYTSVATTIIDPDGNLRVEKRRIEDRRKKKINKIPIIRGIVNFFVSLYEGVKTITSSSAMYLEDEPTEKQVKNNKKNKAVKENVEMTFTVVLAVALAVLLFFVLPNVLISLLDRFLIIGTYGKNILEGLTRLLIFFVYLISVSQIKDIKRTFMFHGAEHKTINCYEKGLELTIPNIKKQTRINDRCGTTFLFLVMFIALLVYAFVPWLDNFILRLLLRLAILPFVAGISYDILMLLSKYDNKFVNALKKPGLALQYLTTKEPNDEKILMCALSSFKAVLEMEEDPSIKEELFLKPIMMKNFLEKQKKVLSDYDDKAALDWIICDTLHIGRNEIVSYPNEIKILDQYRMQDMISRLLAGEPLQYILGYADFYGLRLKVTSDCLIPRPETEILAETAIKLLKDGDNVLDMCCGSGAIGLAIKANKDVKVTSCDISSPAIKVAKENAKSYDLKVRFIESDMFSSINNTFNMIVSNPPYIKTSEIKNLETNVKDYDPTLALDGGRDGLKFYRVLAKESKEYLVEGGYLILEVGDAEGVLKLLEKDYTTKVIKDYNGIDRIIVAQLKE